MPAPPQDKPSKQHAGGGHSHVRLDKVNGVYEMKYIRMGETVECFAYANAILFANPDEPEKDGYVTVRLITDANML